MLLTMLFRVIAASAMTLSAPIRVIAWVLRRTGCLRTCTSQAHSAFAAQSSVSIETTIIDGLATDMLCFAPAAPKQLNSQHDHVIIVIPGNPGVVDFYADYCRELHRKLDEATVVYTVGHAGHSISSQTTSTSGSRIFNLSEQLAHKLSAINFLQKRHPSAKFTLVGHSIGAWMCIELLKSLEEAHVKQLLLLFPTVMHIGDTPNGIRLTPLFQPLQTPLSIMVSALNMLPFFVRNKLFSLYLGLSSSSSSLSPLHRMLSPHVVRNCFTMGHHEMQEVNAANMEVLSAVQHKVRREGVIVLPCDSLCCEQCVWCFGKPDNWNKEGDDDVIRSMLPTTTVHTFENVPHAFVLSHSAKIASWSAEWIAAHSSSD